MKSSRWLALAASSCLLAAALGSSPAVQAGSGDAALPPTEVVHFADLNLDTSAGVRVLYGRIRAAARDVCAPFEPVGSLFVSAAWRSCFDQAIVIAVRRVDRPMLTAYYESQEGRATTARRPTAATARG